MLYVGVDACNTALGVLIFAASMNLGNSWMTILSLFGCKLRAPVGYSALFI
jgi:ethanolaminephosphotransferase